MKLLAGLAISASLASAAVAAASEAALVYLLRPQELASSSSAASSSASASSYAQLPRQVVRQLILQRLGADDSSPFAESLPADFDPETALDFFYAYGIEPPTLFAETNVAGQATRQQHQQQLVLAIEGVSASSLRKIQDAFAAESVAPSFAVSDPPSAAANKEFFASELARASLPLVQKDLASALEAVAQGAWSADALVGLYDAKKVSNTVDAVIDNIRQLVALAKSGQFEALVLFVPESARSSALAHWATKALPKRAAHKREGAAESVMMESSDNAAAAAASSVKAANSDKNNKEPISAPQEWAVSASVAIPSCFTSFNACMTQTHNCSSHGFCVDKYSTTASHDGATRRDASTRNTSSASSCYVCHCQATLNRPQEGPGGLSTTHWGGNRCHKKDVSVPFWLLAGFTVAFVGALSFAIGLLFSVGEEKLPGVIGAGVSRSK